MLEWWNLEYTIDSKSIAFKGLRVRVSPQAPNILRIYTTII